MSCLDIRLINCPEDWSHKTIPWVHSRKRTSMLLCRKRRSEQPEHYSKSGENNSDDSTPISGHLWRWQIGCVSNAHVVFGIHMYGGLPLQHTSLLCMHAHAQSTLTRSRDHQELSHDLISAIALWKVHPHHHPTTLCCPNRHGQKLS